MLDQQAVGRLSRMDALQKQNMELATEQRRQQRLHIIEAALARIQAGDFGFCIICDEQIPPQRLAFDPAVACCIDCRD
jgi:DnaK suppressor protein